MNKTTKHSSVVELLEEHLELQDKLRDIQHNQQNNKHYLLMALIDNGDTDCFSININKVNRKYNRGL